MSDLRGSARWAWAGLAVVVLALAGCNRGEPEPQPSDSVTPPTDAQVLASDGRFDGGPLTEKQTARVCDDVAGTLQDRLVLDDRPAAEFADGSCDLASFQVPGGTGSRSALVEMSTMNDELLARAADLLRDNGATYECAIGMTRGADFSRYVMELDSGVICTTIPEFHAGAAIASDFTLRSTTVKVTAKSSHKGSPSAFDEAIQVRDTVVDAVRKAMNNA